MKRRYVAVLLLTLLIWDRLPAQARDTSASWQPLGGYARLGVAFEPRLPGAAGLSLGLGVQTRRGRLVATGWGGGHTVLYVDTDVREKRVRTYEAGVLGGMRFGRSFTVTTMLGPGLVSAVWRRSTFMCPLGDEQGEYCEDRTSVRKSMRPALLGGVHLGEPRGSVFITGNWNAVQSFVTLGVLLKPASR